MNDRPETTLSNLSGTGRGDGLIRLAQAEATPNQTTVQQQAPSQPVAQAAPTAEPGQAPATPYQPPSAGLPALLTIEKDAKIDPAAVKITLTPEPGKPLPLPADTQIAAILVSGDDLIIREADGDLIVITGGAKNVPSIVVGSIEIPSAALAASLQASGVTLPAAGDAGAQAGGQAAPGSSGGNFARGPGGIGDPFNIRDLLDFSERDRGTEKKQLGENQLKNEPDFRPSILPSQGVDVDEDGLKGANPDGTDNPLQEIDGGGLAIRSGSIVVDFGGAGDVPVNLNNPNLSFAFTAAGLSGQLQDLDGNDIVFAIQGQKLVGSVGNEKYIEISVTGAVLAPDGHTVTYTYEVNLLRAIMHDGNSLEDTQTLNNIQFVVTDRDGDTSTGSIDVRIYDDVIERAPLIAGDDTPPMAIISASVREDGMTGSSGGDLSTGIGGASSDDEASGSAGQLQDLFIVGADSPMKIGLSLANANLPTLYSHGDEVSYTLSPDGHTLSAMADGRVVFTLTVTDNGDWTFDLKDQLDHASGSGDTGTLLLVKGGGTVSAIDFSSVITASDADHDEIIGATPGAFVIAVENDVPEIVGERSLNVNVTEDSLGHGSQTVPDYSLGNTDDANDVAGTADETVITTAALNGYFATGADESLVYGLNAVVSGAVFDANGKAVTSNGDDVVWGVDGSGAVVGYVDSGSLGFDAGDRIIFSITQTADGFAFDLRDQIDHPVKDGDDTETLALNIAPALTASDYDGDRVDLSSAKITVTVEDDVPLLTARDPVTETTTTTTTDFITFDLHGGNSVVGGVPSIGTKGVWVTAQDLNESDNTANLSNNSIGIGDGQIIDGFEKRVTGNNKVTITGPEILTIEMFKDITTDNAGKPTGHGASYDADVIRFSVDVAQGGAGVQTGVVYIGITDNAAPEGFSVTINGVAATGTAVYSGSTIVGYVFQNVPDEAQFEVKGVSSFDTLQIGNFDNYEFADSPSTTTVIDTGSSFKVYDLEVGITTTTTVTTVETFKVSIDESPGVNTAADPNAANDVAGGAPAGIAAYGDVALAQSAGNLTSLFTATVGADEDGNWGFAITDKDGNAINGADSTLKTLDGTPILLFTSGGVILGKAGDTVVFAITADGSGKLWVAQDLPIQNGVAGSAAAAYDDIVSLTNTLFVTATYTDADGDPATITSPIGLQIDFQDDGPKAVDDSAIQAAENADVVIDVSDNDIPGTDGVDWDNTPATAVSYFNLTGTGQLTYNNNGTFTYKPGPGEEGEVSFDYTITDGDGDKSSAHVTITLKADSKPTGGSAAASVDDDGFSGANTANGSGDLVVPNTDGDNNEATFSGTLGGSVGGDTAGTNGFSFAGMHGTTGTVGQETVSYAVVGNVLTATGPRGVLFTVTITNAATGDYTVELKDNVLHLGAGDENDATALISYSITDADGSTVANNILTVTFDDDVPTAVAESDSVAEGNTLAGQFDFIAGADGASISAINGTTLSFGSDGYSQPISLGGGSIKVTATGAYIFTAPGEDVYIDAGTISGTFTVRDSDGDSSNGNFSFSVTDTIDPTTVSLSASAVTENAGDTSYVFTATLSNPSHGTTTVVTDQGTITITDGNTTGTLVIASGNGPDVYTDPTSLTATITSATGGNFESLVVGTASATATVSDTITPVTATLTAGAPSYDATGVNITYTVTLSNPGSLPDATLGSPDGPLTFTLANGGTVVFANGQSSGFVTVHYDFGTFSGSIANSIQSVSGAGEYEQIIPTGTTNVAANTVPTGGGSMSLAVSEAALDLIQGGNDLRPGVVTGNSASLTTETDSKSTGISFTATGEAITVAFANPAITVPTVSGLAPGYSISWALVSGQLQGSLISPASVNLGVAIVLGLSGTLTAAAGGTVTPTITATLSDNLVHATGSGSVTISGIGVQATDTSGDTVAGTVSVTVQDDVPVAFAPELAVVENGNTATTFSHDLQFAEAAGADGVGTAVFNVASGAPAVDSSGTQLYFNGQPLFYSYGSNGTDQTVLLAKTTGGTLAFTVDIDPVTDTYTVKLEGTISSGATIDPTIAGFKGGNSVYAAVGADSTQYSPDLLISGSDTVNSSANSFAIGTGQSISSGEVIRFDIVDNLVTNAAVTSGFQYGSHYETKVFSQGILLTGGAGNNADFTVRIFNADDDQVFTGDAGDLAIANFTVKVFDASGVLQNTFVSSGGVATVTNVLSGWTYEVTSASFFDRVELTGSASTDPFKVTGPTVGTINLAPFEVVLPVTGTDGDGDQVSSALHIDFTPNSLTQVGTASGETLTGTTGVDYLIGLDGNDTLIGNNGNDWLLGGRGVDTLTGGAGGDFFAGGSGADVLHLNLNDANSSGATGGDAVRDTVYFDSTAFSGVDTINDFVVGTGANSDVIDLSSLFTVDTAGGQNLSNYVHVSGTQLQVDVDGANGPAGFVQIATITGVVAGNAVSILYHDDQNTATQAGNVSAT